MMADVPLKEYVDHRFDELDRRLVTLKHDVYVEIDKRVITLKDDLDRRVGALNEAKHQNTSTVALIVSLIALLIAASDAVIWAVRR